MRHETSFRHLELASVGLATANAYAFGDYDLPIWKGLFHRMDSLNLDYLSVVSLWSEEYSSLNEEEKQKVPRSWSCGDSSRIHEFLQAGGERIAYLHDIRQVKLATWWAPPPVQPGFPHF